MKAFLSVLMLITLSAAGCATGPGTVLDEESVLRERVQAFWAAKARWDWTTAETYVDPDVRPEIQPYLKELREGPHYAEFKSFEIIEVRIRGEEADVSIKYSVKWTNPLVAGVPVQERQTKEAWLKKKGVWYLLMQRPNPLKIFQRLGPKEEGR
jgi:hypothetical protein